MKKISIIIITIVLLLMCLATVDVTYNALTGDSLYLKLKSRIDEPREIERIGNFIIGDKCSNEKAIEFPKDLAEPHLKKLSQYQDICGSKVTNSMMVFTDMPKDAIIARENAKKLAETLKQFNKYGIKPTVIVEPISEWGLIDFQEFGTGFYDNWIFTYFNELKRQGVTDEMMGTWVPFPEANLPYWNHANAQPADFAGIVNRYLKILKQQFPAAEGSILLNSATYETDDFEWTNGEYVSLRQYVVGLDKNLIDSVGLQGFPWVSPKEATSNAVFNPSEFLNHSLIAEAADILGVKDIWLNTGTFGAKYTIDPENTVYISADKRKDLLNGILSEAFNLKNLGYNVTINIFAQDKSLLPEATDWSYLPNSFSRDEQAQVVFVEFASKANNNKIGLSLFDRQE